MGHKIHSIKLSSEPRKQADQNSHTQLYVTQLRSYKTTVTHHGSYRLPTPAHCTLINTQSVACVAVADSIPVIAFKLLVIDIGRGAAISISLRVVHGLASRNPVRLRFQDGVAPVGRNQSLAGVDDAERGGEATNHSAGSVWFTGFLVDELHENVIIWGCLRELQDDLVCPLPYVVGENLVSGGTLPVRPD